MMALRISKVFGGSAELWVRMQASHDLREAELKVDQLQLNPIIQHNITLSF